MASRQTSQKIKILRVLQTLDERNDVPAEYMRFHASGNGVSARYFKRVLFISECNGRISELRASGHDIETSTARDEHGFVYHRLKPQPNRAQFLRDAADECEKFENYQPTTNV